MSCCAPGTESALDKAGLKRALPSSEEMMMASRDLGQGLRQIDLSVPGVYCGTCITTVETVLKALPVVERARVNLSSKRVSVIWKEILDGDRTNPGVIAEALASKGYEVHLFGNGEEASDELRNQLIRAVGLTGFASMNVMLLSISVWSGADAATRDMFHWLSALIATPALIYGGRFFYKSAYTALRHGRTNMDVPIAIAITLTYVVSIWETMHSATHVWFDGTVSLLFFLLIGRTLDHVMRDKSRSAIAGLARLSPRGATVLSADGTREYRPVNEIEPGNSIAVAAGERVPVDGAVVSGSSDLDVSIANGESAPRVVRVGDAVQAGTLNLTGPIIIKATAIAKDSFLAEIIGLMEAAEGGRARYRRLADRAAQYYAPVVHLLALIAFVAWGVFGGDWKQALLVAIAVLIITCPCALGLAVPVVQVVAAGRMFKNGIMVKDGSAMERLAEIDTVLFDKTGTLTIGKPRLVNGSDISEATMRLAATIAANSRHPLSQALYGGVAGPFPDFKEITEIPGCGVEARGPLGVYRLGSRAFSCKQNAVASGTDGTSEVVLSLNHMEIAQFCFEDSLRPGVKETVFEFNRACFATEIVSGDRPSAVEALARRVGINKWQGSMAPSEKVGRCEELAAANRKVLMVGDGINDAPALAAAHVSIAPASAADIGRQAADFVFMHSDLRAVAFAVNISKRAGRLIRQNFALAIGYNIIAVPIALAGYATPMIAAIAMSTSSIIVVVNALRLNGFEQKVTASAGSTSVEAEPIAHGAQLA